LAALKQFKGKNKGDLTIPLLNEEKHTKKTTYSFSSLYSPLKAWMETARMQLSWRNLRKKKKTISNLVNSWLCL